MSTEAENTESTEPTEATGEASEANTDASGEAAEETPPVAPPKAQAKVLTIPTRKMAEIKKQERNRGRTEALTAMDQQAQGLGYTSWEDMAAKLAIEKANRGNQTAAEPDEPPTESAAPKKPTRSRADTTLEAENRQLLEERRESNRVRARETRKFEALQKKLDVQQVENELRFAALQSGVQSESVDYAVFAARKAVAGKTAKELEGFSETDFFKQLRKDQPYLYSVETRAAHTSPGPEAGGANGGSPESGSSAASSGNGAPRDAMKMSREEYIETLRKMGLSDPAIGMPT